MRKMSVLLASYMFVLASALFASVRTEPAPITKASFEQAKNKIALVAVHVFDLRYADYCKVQTCIPGSYLDSKSYPADVPVYYRVLRRTSRLRRSKNIKYHIKTYTDTLQEQPIVTNENIPYEASDVYISDVLESPHLENVRSTI